MWGATGSTQIMRWVTTTKVGFSLTAQGYCGYMLTVHDRFLLPANPNIGVLHHRGKYYGFSNKEAADDFAGNPEGSVIVDTFDSTVSTFYTVHMLL